MHHQEIERQFLVKTLPAALDQRDSIAIRQGYLSVTREREIRLRDQDGSYLLTVKDGQGISRTETETVLTPEQFNALWPATSGQRIEKRRYFFPWQGVITHLDFYLGELAGFNILEAEFASLDASDAFVPPDFCGEEITEKGSIYYLKELLSKLPR